MIKRSLFVAAVAAATTIPAAATASTHATAGIVSQKSIAGVKLGQTRDDVEAALGTPKRTKTKKNEFSGTVKELDYGLTTVTLAPGDSSGTVILVDTKSKKYKTAAGIGVGSTLADVKSKVSKAKCESGAGYAYCDVGAALPGKTVTTFYFNVKTKIVTHVALGVVLD